MAGPPPARASARAWATTACTAAASLPSTWWPRMPYPTALCARVGATLCRCSGTLIAQWSFWTRNTTGVFHTAAKL